MNDVTAKIRRLTTLAFAAMALGSAAHAAPAPANPHSEFPDRPQPLASAEVAEGQKLTYGLDVSNPAGGRTFSNPFPMLMRPELRVDAGSATAGADYAPRIHAESAPRAGYGRTVADFSDHTYYLVLRPGESMHFEITIDAKSDRLDEGDEHLYLNLLVERESSGCDVCDRDRYPNVSYSAQITIKDGPKSLRMGRVRRLPRSTRAQARIRVPADIATTLAHTRAEGAAPEQTQAVEQATENRPDEARTTAPAQAGTGAESSSPSSGSQGTPPRGSEAAERNPYAGRINPSDSATADYGACACSSGGSSGLH